MDKIAFLTDMGPFLVAIIGLIVAGWVITTWMRIKNGYPLEGSWGQTIKPHTDKESMERIRLLTSENAQLKAEMGSMKDRLETVERIVTDESHGLAREIDTLRDKPIQIG